MGSASCKNPKSSEQAKEKTNDVKITIGVFGLNDAGKTSTVKTIEGAPTNDVQPTVGSETTKVPYPTTDKGDKKSQDRITIIDVSGSRGFRQRSWPEFYRKIHGLIYVLDASDMRSMAENQKVLEDLLDHEDLNDKPILILANKQDRRGALDEEREIKDKLQIERLRRKHKIEFCSAVPTDRKKADISIRQGFSWLIRAIEEDYTKINSRVNNTDSSRAPKPAERKSQFNNQRRHDSDDSDDGKNIVYNHNRSSSPTATKKSTDYRSMINSIKLPTLDLDKTKGKRSGNETYSESDHDDERSSHSRPNISRFAANNDRHDQTTTSTAGGFNKKKKLTGATTGSNDTGLSTKKSDDNQPKSFRASYEGFPEDSPWSTGKKPTKLDDVSSRSLTKLSTTSDFNKRTTSPLVHDTKLYGSGTQLNRNKNSDDDDDEFSSRQKPKSTLPYGSKPSTTYKKPLSSIYGGDEYDMDSKNSNANRRLNLTPPVLGKKPFKIDEDDEDYSKKTPTKTTKSFGSDDESKTKDTFGKSSQRLTDRFDPMNEYRGLTAKPPPSPSSRIPQSKTDDYRPMSSSLTRSNDRLKSNKDDFSSTYTKPTLGSKFSADIHDDDHLSPLSKPLTRTKHDDINRPSSPWKMNTPSRYDDEKNSANTIKPMTRSNYNNPSPSAVRSTGRSQNSDDEDYGSGSKSTPKNKFGNDDDDTRSSWKPPVRSTFNDTGRSSPPYKSTTRSRYDDDDDFSSSTKPATRLTQNNSGRTSPPYKSTTRSRYDDDDDLPSSSKPATRSTTKDNDRSSSPFRSNARSKYDDDDRSPSPVKRTTTSRYEDDDDDLPSSTKPAARSTQRDSGRTSPPYKSTTRSRYDDDDDLPSSPKTTTRSTFKDNGRSSSPPPYRSTGRSRFDDDDDDNRSPSTVKRTTTSKYEDDDDDLPRSTSKSNNYSSRDTNNKTGIGRTGYSKDPYDS